MYLGCLEPEPRSARSSSSPDSGFTDQHQQQELLQQHHDQLEPQQQVSHEPSGPYDHQSQHQSETDRELVKLTTVQPKMLDTPKMLGPPAYASPPQPTIKGSRPIVQSNLILNQSKQAKHRSINQSATVLEPKLNPVEPHNDAMEEEEGQLSDSSSEEEIGHIIG